MSEYELLNQIKQTHPIVEGGRTTWVNPATLTKTFNIPMKMANKVAQKYNNEVSLMSRKKR